MAWNTGNVGRTALALDAELHLVGKLGFELDDKRVRRAGLDYWEHVRVRRWDDFAQLEAAGLGQVYLFSARADRTYWDAKYEDPCVLVFGRESVGLGDLLRGRESDTFSIPQTDEHVRSLNLSTAVAVVGYEATRQHRSRV
ncbi:MAG: TrmH family RNA methyltransferase [Polyangia bacterium]